jgi:hypothetical protein
MADLPQYTGVTYDAGYFKQPEETMADYMMRLAQQRASGVLGGGGMLDTPQAEEVKTSTPLGQIQQNCPVGYVLRNGACVRADEDADTEEMPEPTMEERYKGARMLLDNPMAAKLARAVIPFGLGNVFLTDNQIEGYVRNAQNEATKSQGFLDYLMGRDGDVVLGDKGTGSGSLVTGTPTEITRGMFPEIFDPYKFSATYGQATTYPVPEPVNYLAQQEQNLQRTMGMMDTLNQLNSGSISGGNSGYYTDTGGNSYTGGSDYGGWTGVTADGSGNDWDSFGGDDTY